MSQVAAGLVRRAVSALIIFDRTFSRIVPGYTEPEILTKLWRLGIGTTKLYPEIPPQGRNRGVPPERLVS